MAVEKKRTSDGVQISASITTAGQDLVDKVAAIANSSPSEEIKAIAELATKTAKATEEIAELLLQISKTGKLQVTR